MNHIMPTSRKLTASGESPIVAPLAALRDQVWSRLLGLVVGIAASYGSLAAAETDALKPAAIQTEDVPPIPAQLAARMRQYQNTRPAGFASWSPDGKGILIRTQFANSLQLHRVYEPGGRREQITFFEEPVDGGFIPKASDGAILLVMDRGGSENDQIYLLDRTKFTTTLLTDGKSKHSLEAIRDDGKLMIVGSNQRNGRDTDLFVADPRKSGFQRTLMEVKNEHWSVSDWSKDGKSLLLTRYVSINESYPALVDFETGKRRDLPLPGNGTAAIGAFEFTPDGKKAYIACDAESEFRRLGVLDLDSGKYEWLTSDIQWDVNGIKVHDESGKVAFTVNADGATQLYLLEQQSGGKHGRRELSIPTGIISSLGFSPDGKQLGFTLARPELPSDAYSIDVASGKLTRWTYAEVGGLDPAKFVSANRIRFPSFDGREIPGWYFRPRSASRDKKAPVLIKIHGGPESQAQPYFSDSTQFYVGEMGLAVLLPNVRGSAGYGKSYLQLDNAEKREDSVKDIGALLDWIAKQPELDASRVAVTGGSYGGFMVLSSLTHFGDRIKAGVDYVGICNFNTFLANTSAYRVDLRRAEYGDERDEKMKAVFERISPANHADKIVSALLVAHGKNDPRVPFSEAEQIAAKVRGQGRTVWTVFADNEGHGFNKKDNDDYLQAVEALFLKKSLGIE
jgi:dipeptidyl aminopeptidase/acylaminoacyl peptidase